MTILHLMQEYSPTISGAAVRNSSMIESYLTNNPEDRIIVIDLQGNKYEKKGGINGVEVCRAGSLKEMIVLARQFIKNENISILHTHNFRFLFAGYVALAGRRKNTRFIVEIHALYRMRRLKEAITRYIIKKTDKVIVLAECAKKHSMKLYGLNEEKYTVIRNGMSDSQEKTDVIIPKEKMSFFEKAHNQNRLVAGYFGSFYDWQGVCFVADNFSRIIKNENVALIMLGNGPEYESVKSKSECTDVADFVLVNPGVEKSISDAIGKMCDIIIIPRITNLSTNTAVPLKAVESLESGACILCADDDGLREVMNDENAEIFEAGNIDSFMSHLHLLCADPNRRESKAAYAKTSAQNNFVTWVDCAEKLKQVYKSVRQEQ